MANINRKKLEELASIEFYCEPEWDLPEGYFATGEPEDSEAIAWIRQELRDGNPWAWCTLNVRATLEDVPALGGASLVGLANVGGCSFEGEFDARASEFETLKTEALDDLAHTLEQRLTQKQLSEMGLLDGPPARYLVATFDVTHLNEAQIAALWSHVAAQAEASDMDYGPEDGEAGTGMENYPDLDVQIDVD